MRFMSLNILGYVDFATDIICCAFFYNPHKAFPLAFALAFTGLMLPSVIMLLLPRQDWKRRILTLFRCRLTYEAVISWQNELETIEFWLVELIESVAGGFPSALIQSYAIMFRSVYDSDTTFDLLGPSYIVYASIVVSVLASSWSSMRLFTTNEERHGSNWFKILLCMYYGSEKLYRVLYYCVISLFLSSAGYRHGRNPFVFHGCFLLVSLAARLCLVRYSHQRVNPHPWSWEENWNFTGRLCMSLATSHMWVGEYILTCRFLMLEFLELAFYVPFFLWLQHVTHFEQYHFNANIPVCVTVYFYMSKMALLAGRLFYTPNARHVLYNHMSILLKEAAVVVVLVLLLWAILIAVYYFT